MAKLELGLRAQLLAAFAVVLLLLLLVVSIFDASVDQHILDESRRSGEAVAEALQVSVQQLGASNQPDEDMLRDFVQRSGQVAVHQLRVLDSAKRPLAQARAHTVLIEEQERPGRSRTWDLLIPVITGSNKLGYVELRMTEAPLEKALAAFRARRALLLAAGFALGLMLLGFIAALISRPLTTLERAASRVAAGELEVELPSSSTAEVGTLVRAFRQMLSGLKDRERLRGQLAEAEREAWLGRLAAGVAHDVRNPLNYISLAVEHWMATQPSPDTERMGAQIKKEIARANQRIGELLRLGRPIAVHPSPVSLSALLEQVRDGTATPGHPVQVDSGGLGQARCDAGVVEEILRNLVSNAQQAAPGLVEIRAEAREGALLIHVEDRGPGLDPAVKPRLFEPWFSTKAEGIGLGLALSRKAAREHGGELSAEDRPGGGARFTLRLPQALNGGEDAGA